LIQFGSASKMHEGYEATIIVNTVKECICQFQVIQGLPSWTVCIEIKLF